MTKNPFKAVSATLATLICLFLISCGADETSSDGSGSDDGTAGSTSRIVFQRDYLLVIDGNRIEARSVDAETGQLTLVSAMPLEVDEAETLFAYEDDKVMVGTPTGTYILEISEQGRLSQTAWVSHAQACDPVIAKDNAMYVTTRTETGCRGWGQNSNQLLVYDITDIANPVETSRIPLNQPSGLTLKDNNLYVCTYSGLAWLKVDSPLEPTFLDTLPMMECNDIIADQNNNTLILTSNESVSVYKGEGDNLVLQSSIYEGM
jgi:hypothetical protein